MFPHITIGVVQLPTYWLLSMLGICISGLYLLFSNQKGYRGTLPKDDLLHIGLLGLIGAVVGGKLLYILVSIPFIFQNWAFFSSQPTLLASFLLGGLVFYGGLGGALAAGTLYCRAYNIPLKTAVAIFTPAFPLFHFFGRLGCFSAGCCWGIPVPWGVSFPHSLSSVDAHLTYFPVQLVEAAFNLTLFFLLAFAGKRFHTKWLVFPLYLTLYSIGRFILEFFRGDRIRGIFILSTSQWISLFIVIGVAFVFLKQQLLLHKKNSRKA